MITHENLENWACCLCRCLVYICIFLPAWWVMSMRILNLQLDSRGRLQCATVFLPSLVLKQRQDYMYAYCIQSNFCFKPPFSLISQYNLTSNLIFLKNYVTILFQMDFFIKKNKDLTFELHHFLCISYQINLYFLGLCSGANIYGKTFRGQICIANICIKFQIPQMQQDM